MLNLKVTFLILFFPYFLWAQHNNWEPETISVEDGLRSDGVRAILKDRQGFMWFGTKMGLQRYDGYQFKTYKYDNNDSVSLSDDNVLDVCEDRDGNLWIALNKGLNKLDPRKNQIIHYTHKPEDSTSISGGAINSVFEDSHETIWVGTTTGLDRFDPVYESFIHYTHNSSDSTSINGNFVAAIYEDKENTMWIGTIPGGLNKMDKSSGTFKRIVINPMEPLSLSNSVTCIYEDKSGNLWVGTMDGLFQFDRKDGKFSRVFDNSDSSHIPQSQIIASFNEGTDGNYWIRTNSGLYLFDADLKRIDAWEHLTSSPLNGVWRNTKSMYQDNCRILWYGKHYKGIEKLIPKNNNFKFYANPNIESRSIRGTYVENKDIIWLATKAGLTRLDRKKNEYQLFLHNPKDLNTISSNGATKILRDQKGILWIGTSKGLNKLVLTKENTYKIFRYKHNPNDPASIANDWVTQIYEDQSGRLYLMVGNGKIDILDGEKEEFLHLEYYKGNQKMDQFGSILLEEPGRIWIGGRGVGLSEIILPFRKSDDHTISPDTIIQYKSEQGGLNANTITCMHKDQMGTYWLGTEGGGLNKMIISNSKGKDGKVFRFEYFTKKNGLCSDEINDILEDNKGRLWLGTENGISRFDPETENFTNYNKTDGLLSYAFSFQGYKSQEGEMFFPSDNGLLAFYPDSIVDNPIIPPVVITDLKIFNETVPVGGKSPLQTSISSTEEITLPYNQNFLSFEFAALNYLHTEKNRYKYKMEGLDPDWITAGTRRHADYPDLKPGEYTFRVIGSNNNAIWNMEGASLHISILPPWWATYYAYSIYVFLLIALIMGYVRFRTWQVRNEKQILEKQVQVRTHQIEERQREIESQKELLQKQNVKILDMDQMKTKFFNNISHEFRTPLTLIQGPVEDLMADARLNKKEQNKLQLISQNAGRLLDLVNQLLDVAKLSSGQMKLKLVNGDIMQSLRIMVGSFSSMAETQGIIYNRSIPMGKYNTWFDYGILEKIVVNLLSNAFKFSPEAGEIAFCARWFHGETMESPDQLQFSISDQGPGIPQYSIDKIFTRFYQIEGQGNQTTAGTGIGLSLVQDLVNLNHGDIKVESETGKGATFTVRLPLGKDHLNEREYDFAPEKEKFQHNVPDPTIAVTKSTGPSDEPEDSEKSEGKLLVLIVDDNVDIRCHISENLESNYQIIEAVNGRSGIKRAQEIIPDLIITDLIMPVMDGLELCRQLKTDERTSHIPIIMLTAKTSMEEKLEGLVTGADDYISKPFHMKELKTRIANLIEQRKKLRERFSKEITLEPSEIFITSIDENFLKRAIATVEDHMDDENFDILKFQDAMHMSHSTLFRKLLALTDQSPSNFIRNIRLKRAAYLMKENFGNVAKISYEVGFNNPSYFSKCFKSQFGISPIDYAKKHSYDLTNSKS